MGISSLKQMVDPMDLTSERLGHEAYAIVVGYLGLPASQMAYGPPINQNQQPLSIDRRHVITQICIAPQSFPQCADRRSWLDPLGQMNLAGVPLAQAKQSQMHLRHRPPTILGLEGHVSAHLGQAQLLQRG